MKILCVIPARLQSTRLARKALLPIQGKPMVQWTYENAKKCALFDNVIVATDSDEIATLIRNINGNVQMTASDIPSGSERVAAVARDYPDMDVIINLQGDEPFIKASMLEALLVPYLQGDQPEMATLAYPLAPDRYTQPGAVKVITDLYANALYFSRSPIPYYRAEVAAPVYNHMGVYAFRADFLQKYCLLPQTPLEKSEQLEQLRVLEHGYKIRVCVVPDSTLEINTQEEYEAAQRFLYA